MQRYFIILLIYLFSPKFICVGQEINNIRGTSWLSIDYIKQMENHLPCECANSGNYGYYISIASKNIEKTDDSGQRVPEIILNYIIQTDGARQFFILSEDSNKYVIVDNYNKWNSTLELKLVGDTLLLLDNGKYRKFIKSNFSFEYHTDKIYVLDNIVLLNKSLVLRGYPTIENILKEDSLELFCNGWAKIMIVNIETGEIIKEESLITNCNICPDNINMVCSRKQNKLWILEINNGYLFVKKVTNSQIDPLDKIRTKTIKKLKWVQMG